jgi:hypothetical protein
VSTAVGPSPPREIPMQMLESKPIQTSVMSAAIQPVTDTKAIKSSTEIQTESSIQKIPETSNKFKTMTSTGTSPPPQSISTQVRL